MRVIRGIVAWINQRVQFEEPVRDLALHRVPRTTASWWYVFGSASAVLFALQVLTGICLGLTYTPSAGEAWNSLLVLNYQQPLGWFLRAMHGWGSNFMIAVVLLHMAQVFLFGAYKYPRELTWMVGVLLLLLTFGMAFTGQVLRFDQDAYWGLGIGASIAGRVPVVGGALVDLLLGGPTIAGSTLTRFFTLHVFVLPATLLGLIGLHVMLVLKLGVNEWPMPGRMVTRERYLVEYHELTSKDGVPFVPDAFSRDLVAAGIVVTAVAACAAFFGPFGPSGPPDPTNIDAVPRPDYFFLWLFAVLSLLPPWLETPVLLVAPVLVVGALLLLPLVSGVGEKSWRRRPFAVLTVLVAAVALAALTRLGARSPWSPVMDAWTAEPVPSAVLKGRSALERQGAAVFQVKQCRNCHALGGEGGMRGPELDDVATRLTRNQLIRQVLQGGGNMPAYGNNLSPPEVDALVSFLGTLYPSGTTPARDASDNAATGTRPDAP